MVHINKKIFKCFKYENKAGNVTFSEVRNKRATLKRMVI